MALRLRSEFLFSFHALSLCQIYRWLKTTTDHGSLGILLACDGAVTAMDMAFRQDGTRAVDARITSLVSMTFFWIAPGSSTMRAAMRPFSAPMLSIVVNGGLQSAASGMSLYPTTDKSLGTTRPRSQASSITRMPCIADIESIAEAPGA